MSNQRRKKTNPKITVRIKHKTKIRARLSGTTERPRLAVFRSNAHIYVQLIDDVKATTIAAASTQEKELRGKAGASIEGAKLVGSLIAKRAQSKGVKAIVFDRGGYVYHGKVKALADSAREAGLQF